ncbi:XVIPCD domain-containing protein [Lysobacter antibioticus]|uniref:XVIPCD domain-containing protein n=1 Tax=Lysobacter antibioticus TaxID=84531 RepID=UPI00126A0ABC|nr:XVIPCD domain-containing protein [Lysobacter antibioticus]
MPPARARVAGRWRRARSAVGIQELQESFDGESGMRVKVGLDEWLAADPKQTDLITDGLLGCVAVGLTGKDRIALTHVYDEAKDQAFWPGYQEKLDAALQASNLGEPDEVRAVLVYSDHTSEALCGRIEKWLQRHGIESERREDDGCRVSDSTPKPAVTIKSEDSSDEYMYGYLTTRDSDAAVARFALSKEAGAATPALQDPQASLGIAKIPALSEPSHPGCPLYASILKEVKALDGGMFKGKDIWEQQIAAELTAQCLDAGIREIKGVAPGTKDVNQVFVLPGQQESARHDLCVHAFEVDETTIAGASERAFKHFALSALHSETQGIQAQTQQGGQTKGM